MAYRQSGGSSRQQESGYRYNARDDEDDKIKPEKLGRKAVKKDDQQNAPRQSPKKKPASKAPTPTPKPQQLPAGGARHVGGAGSGPANFAGDVIPTPTPKPQQLPEGGLRHVGGAGSGPANFAGSAIPTPTPSPGPPLNDLAASPPRPDNFQQPAGNFTPPAPPSFTPPMNPALSQASILQTPPPELQAPMPFAHAGTETSPHPVSLGNSMAGQERSPYPVPGNSMAGTEMGPMGSDPKDVLARLLMLARQGGAPGGAPGQPQPPQQQPQTGALGFPIPPNPFGGF